MTGQGWFICRIQCCSAACWIHCCWMQLGGMRIMDIGWALSCFQHKWCSMVVKWKCGTGWYSRHCYPNHTKIRISELVLLPTVLVSSPLSPVAPQALSTPILMLQYQGPTCPSSSPNLHPSTSILQFPRIKLNIIGLITLTEMWKLGKEPAKCLYAEVKQHFQDTHHSSFIVDM